MLDIISLGELLIDFTPQQNKSTTPPSYTANPGGAPANVVVALSQLGYNTAMIASVGKDAFGTLLTETLAEKGVQTKGISMSDIPTTLAFVHLGTEGERSFSFYRQPGADFMLTEADVPVSLIEQTSIFHVGSLSMTNSPAREATRFGLEVAKKRGKIISYDPNYRPMLWNNPTEAKKCMLDIMTFAHIVKVSDDELEFLTEQSTLEEGATELLQQYDVTLLFVTLGAKGSYCFHQNGSKVFVKGLPVDAVDTTGCGDAFFAGVLSKFLTYKVLEFHDLTENDLVNITSYGNALGAYVATQHGAIPAMPTRKELEVFLKQKG